MTNEVTVVPVSAIEHWVYCPRQCVLIHGDGVWTDNAFTTRGRRVHQRADSGERRTERGRQVLRSIPLWSERYGLSGRADAIEFHDDGAVVPVEYKSGFRHGDAALLQVVAQALCLEEMFDTTVGTVAVWYEGVRRRDTWELTDELRGRAVDCAAQIRSALDGGMLPAPVDDERCRQCQLIGHCMPTICADVQRVRNYCNGLGIPCDT